MAKLLYTNTAGLLPSIESLEAAGYLKMVEVDGRPGFMQLTDEGMAEGRRRAAHHTTSSRELMACLSDEEQAQLVALLSKLLAATKTA
jgi:DNA-binding MarR family transcriptional regulator